MALLITFIVMLLFGIGYNAFVHYAETHGYDKGYTADFVVGGVSVNILAITALDIVAPQLPAGLVALVCFCGSGLPMWAGAWYRNARERVRLEQEQQARQQPHQLDKAIQITATGSKSDGAQ